MRVKEEKIEVPASNEKRVRKKKESGMGKYKCLLLFILFMRLL